METNEIIEGNNLIEHFNGYYLSIGEGLSSEQLDYHTNWNSLMSVVEKIEYLGFKFQICRKRVTIIEDKGTELHVGTTKKETKISSIWFAVVDFIKWHNDNNK